MGKIKSKGVRRSARTLVKEGVNFSSDFEKNKKILEGLTIGKKLRNQLAGLLAKSKKRELSQQASK
ncbi:30S ribosomal protein S17e [uncultured archaeon]|nr:30S ribosomal protein S17e [uncultured archaeon]